jgi:hypothetical protein
MRPATCRASVKKLVVSSYSTGEISRPRSSNALAYSSTATPTMLARRFAWFSWANRVVGRATTSDRSRMRLRRDSRQFIAE